jgi:glycosyltransferase involved in cell wall biosynthesis
MSPRPPLVSVVTASRNRAALLARAIRSVEADTHRPIELIVIDNASDTPISASSSTIDVRVLRNPRMELLPVNRNIGIQAALGEFVAFLDDDDEYVNGKIARLLAQIGGADAIFGGTAMIGPGGRKLGVCHGSPALVDVMLYAHAHINSWLIRRHVFAEVLFDPAMRTFEDLDFIFRLIRRFRVVSVDDVVATWNRDGRADQLSKRNLARSFESHERLCDRFRAEIDADPRLARRYYGKAALLATTQLRPVTAARRAAAWLARGLLAGDRP